MDCIECKTTNPDSNHFCGQCGAELGRSVVETVKKDFRDRRAVEMEITESVVDRLMKWGTWLGSITAVIVALFGLMLGWSYHDVRTAVATGKTEIGTAVQQGKNDIGAVRQTIIDLKVQVAEVESDTNRYKQVNSDIGKLQKKLMAVQGQILDLGSRTLRVGTLETTGTGGPSSMSFGNLGCQPSALPEGQKVAYCAEGSPPSIFLFQRTFTGDLRPVSSVSPVGFQDASNARKPTCTAANRGTFYVEKGSGKMADKPFLCARKSDNTFDWIQLVMVP
jgi:hypothetical protein